MLLKLNIGPRLAAVIGLGVLVALILAIHGLIGLNATQQSLKTVYEDRLVPLRDLALINEHTLENKFLLLNTLSSSDSEDISKDITQLESNDAEISKIWNAYLATFFDRRRESIDSTLFGIKKQVYQGSSAASFNCLTQWAP